MSRQRYRVLAVALAAQHPAETVYRLVVRPVERTEPTYVLYWSQPAARTDVPHDVGAVLDLDARLLAQE